MNYLYHLIMRYQPEHKEQTRSLVLSEASKAIRKDGPAGVSLAAIMKRAGLTHGGFYAHFASRDELIAAAITQMFDDIRDRWVHETLDRTPVDGLSRYVDWYLSKSHRDNREAGCPVAALASDLPRLSEPCQKAYAEGTRRIFSTITAQVEQAGVTDAKYVVSSVLAEMVGALSLARIEPDPRRSDGILKASLRSVKQRLGIGGAS